MSWAGCTWMSGWVGLNGVRIQRHIMWMSEEDLIDLTEDLMGADDEEY